jgi:thiamine pyrophosphate-dependent acetolactate synthase large subunit-like protein
MRATNPQALRSALRDAFKRAGPTLIEVPVGEMSEPRRFTALPRVRPQTR